jgi:hypothetical protein
MLTISNFSQAPFTGWVPCSSPRNFADTKVEQADVQIGEATVRVHRGMTQGDARSVWVKVAGLQPMSAIDVDLEAQEEVPDPPLMLPDYVCEDPARRFAPSVNGVPLATVIPQGGDWLTEDGPALRAHFRQRVSVLVWADVYLTWCPDEPWFRWEMTLNAANQARGEVITEFSTEGFTLKIGDAVVATFGGHMGPMMKGQSIAQGQMRTFAGIGAWLDQATHEQQQSLVGMLSGAPQGVDDRWFAQVGGMGCPQGQTQFNEATFAQRHIGNALSSMHTWQGVPQIGVAPNSGVTGAQEEQVFSANGTEVFSGDLFGPANLFIRYMVALTYSRRPCHWREDDGRLLDFDAHPDLVFWNSAPHWHAGISPDRLGLQRLPQAIETHGWSGADRQHIFFGSLYLAASLTMSQALQAQLEAQARVMWFGETVPSRNPSASTNGAGASRSVGWFGILVDGLASTMRKGEAIDRVMLRARERVDEVYLPQLHRPAEQWRVWDQRRDDRISAEFPHHFENITLEDGSVVATSPTLPQGALTYTTIYHWLKGWMPYQQAVGAYGLLMLGQRLGHAECIEAAQHAARTVTELAYTTEPVGSPARPAGGVQEWPILPLNEDGTPIDLAEYHAAVTLPFVGWFRHAWMPLALATRLRKEGDPDAWAMQAWQVLWSEHEAGQGVMRWMPPADRVRATSGGL